MPSYDYYSEETGEVKEVFHSIHEDPDIFDSQGNLMKKVISGGSGFIFHGGTRNKSWGTRYGKKKTSNLPTAQESAQFKAEHSLKESQHHENLAQDPYYNFREH